MVVDGSWWPVLNLRWSCEREREREKTVVDVERTRRERETFFQISHLMPNEMK